MDRATADSTIAHSTFAHRVARVVTEVCSPAVVVLLLPLAVAWHATGYRIGPTIGWGLVVAVFSSVLPMAFIVRGARLGRWDGHHVRNREGRLVPLVLCLASTALGLAILLFGHAPSDVVALDVAMLVTLLVCTVITRWWKISLHAAVAGGAAATLVLLYGPFLLVLVPVVVLVAWSRVEVSDHTVTQVVAGALVGPILGGAVFLLVR
jgi:membrane-associated phospholipid phosphatase